MAISPEDRVVRFLASQTICPENVSVVKKEVSRGVSWAKLYRIAASEGLAPLVYSNCQKLEILPQIPTSINEKFKIAYRQTLFHNHLILKFLNDLSAELKDKTLQIIVLKGAALIDSVYSDAALRPMEDVDLLVRPSDKESFKKILSTMGFAPEQLYPDTFRKDIICVDLHTDFLSSHRIKSRKSLVKYDSEDVWRRAEPVFKGEMTIYRLCTYDNLVALSFHLLKHNFSRLVWFVDICEILKENSNFNWTRFGELTGKSGSNRVVAYVLLLVRNFFQFQLVDNASTILSETKLSIIETYILRIRLANEPLGRLPQVLYLFQLKQISKKLTFIKENIFPRSEVMSQIQSDCSDRHSFSTYCKRGMSIVLSGIQDLVLGGRAVLRGSLPKLNVK